MGKRQGGREAEGGGCGPLLWFPGKARLSRGEQTGTNCNHLRGLWGRAVSSCLVPGPGILEQGVAQRVGSPYRRWWQARAWIGGFACGRLVPGRGSHSRDYKPPGFRNTGFLQKSNIHPGKQVASQTFQRG